MQWAIKRRREQRRNWSRITITLSAKALEVVDYVRYAQDSSASDAIDYLILKTEPKEPRIQWINGLPVFHIEDDGPPITNEDVQRILDAEYVYPRKAQKPTPQRITIAISPDAAGIVGRLRKATRASMSTVVSELIERSA
jgi:hypothetical protein